MKGYDTKEAMAGHRYNMSEKHRRRESEGMKRAMDKGSSSDRIDKASKHTYGVNTMSEGYDMSRVQIKPTTLRGQPSQAWDYEY